MQHYAVAQPAGEVGDRCTFVEDDFTRPDFEITAEATVVYIYLLPWALEYLAAPMERALARGCRFVRDAPGRYLALRRDAHGVA